MSQFDRCQLYHVFREVGDSGEEDGRVTAICALAVAIPRSSISLSLLLKFARLATAFHEPFFLIVVFISDRVSPKFRATGKRRKKNVIEIIFDIAFLTLIDWMNWGGRCRKKKIITINKKKKKREGGSKIFTFSFVYLFCEM